MGNGACSARRGRSMGAPSWALRETVSMSSSEWEEAYQSGLNAPIEDVLAAAV